MRRRRTGVCSRDSSRAALTLFWATTSRRVALSGRLASTSIRTTMGRRLRFYSQAALRPASIAVWTTLMAALIAMATLLIALLIRDATTAFDQVPLTLFCATSLFIKAVVPAPPAPSQRRLPLPPDAVAAAGGATAPALSHAAPPAPGALPQRRLPLGPKRQRLR